MAKKGGDAPAPDYAGLVAAQAAAQQSQLLYALGREQLDWARQRDAQDRQSLKPILDQFLDTQKKQGEFSDRQRKFYEEQYQPLEKEYIQTAKTWDSPERREAEAGRAQAGVAQQFEQARQSAAQQLKDFGIDPTSGRYAATDLMSRTMQGAASAAAGNEARRTVEQQGLALKANAINVGRGYPGAVATTAQTGIQAGGAYGQNLLNQSQIAGANMGNPTQYFGGSNQAMGIWGNISNNNYQNYLEGYKIANQPQSSGIGSALGLIGGLASSFNFEEGGGVPDHASPTRGAAVDDVPARLTAGEFIVPKRAVEWFGEKHMHELIAKADKERQQLTQQTGAVPDTAPAPREQPTLASRPSAAALPMG